MVTDNMIFVFGSNLAGIHGAGAAKWAKYARGAKQGVGVGLCGQSYAIPTKDHELKPLSLGIIYGYIKDFKEYAITHPKKQFQVTQVGCGLAKNSKLEIAPLFYNSPRNCFFDTDWIPWLGSEHNYWGHYA